MPYLMSQGDEYNTGSYADKIDYEINDVMEHPIRNMPTSKHEGGTELGLAPMIGPNRDLGDE